MFVCRKRQFCRQIQYTEQFDRKLTEGEKFHCLIVRLFRGHRYRPSLAVTGSMAPIFLWKLHCVRGTNAPREVARHPATLEVQRVQRMIFSGPFSRQRREEFQCLRRPGRVGMRSRRWASHLKFWLQSSKLTNDVAKKDAVENSVQNDQKSCRNFFGTLLTIRRVQHERGGFKFAPESGQIDDVQGENVGGQVQNFTNDQNVLIQRKIHWQALQGNDSSLLENCTSRAFF